MLEITLGSLFDYPQTKKAEAIMRKRHSVLIMKKYIFVTGRLLESHMRLRKIGPIIIDSPKECFRREMQPAIFRFSCVIYVFSIFPRKMCLNFQF